MANPINQNLRTISTSLQCMLVAGGVSLTTLSSGCGDGGQEVDTSNLSGTHGGNGAASTGVVPGTVGTSGSGVADSLGTQGGSGSDGTGGGSPGGTGGGNPGGGTGSGTPDATGDNGSGNTGDKGPEGTSSDGTGGGDGSDGTSGSDSSDGTGSDDGPDVVAGVPVADAKCAKDQNIKHPSNGVGVEFNADCSIAYVLPPITGPSKIGPLAVTMNARFCPSVKSGAETLDSTTRQIADLKRRLKEVEQELEKNGEDETLKKKQESLLDQLSTVTQLHETATDMFKDYAVMQGATGNVTFRLELDKLAQAYKNENPQFSGRFIPVPLDDLRFHAAVDLEFDSNFPAIQGLAIPALNVPPAPKVSDEPVSEVPDALSFEKGEATKFLQMGPVKAANVALSLVGICQWYDEETEKLDQEAFAKSLTVSFSYSYPVQAQRQYVVKYNMSRWLDEIESFKDFRAPFSASSLKNIAENTSSSDWMSVDFSKSEGGFTSSQEQAVITKEVADTLQVNAINQLALQHGTTAPDGASADLTEAGIQAWAKQQRKECGSFSFCYIADYVGESLSGIWDDEKAITKFKSTNAELQTRKVQGTTMLRRFGSVKFTPNESPL